MNSEYERCQKWKSKLQCTVCIVECDRHDKFAEDHEYKKQQTFRYTFVNDFDI